MLLRQPVPYRSKTEQDWAITAWEWDLGPSSLVVWEILVLPFDLWHLEVTPRDVLNSCQR